MDADGALFLLFFRVFYGAAPSDGVHIQNVCLLAAFALKLGKLGCYLIVFLFQLFRFMTPPTVASLCNFSLYEASCASYSRRRRIFGVHSPPAVSLFMRAHSTSAADKAEDAASRSSIISWLASFSAASRSSFFSQRAHIVSASISSCWCSFCSARVARSSLSDCASERDASSCARSVSADDAAARIMFQEARAAVRALMIPRRALSGACCI